MKSTLRKIRNAVAGGLPAINLQQEVQPYLHHLKGLVLNAGAGHRPVTTGRPTLAIDFDETSPVDLLADLHYLPLRDGCVDSVLSVAVLEHTRIPWECARELWRVLKPGGTVVICVPFLQPEHAVPHDFFRYTVYGLQSMLEWAGFNVHSVERIGRQHRSLAWILLEMSKIAPRWKGWGLRILATFIARRAKTGNLPPVSVYTGSYAVAQKPGSSELSQDIAGNTGWFLPLLRDPVSKKPIRVENGEARNEEGDIYKPANGIIDLRPKHGLSQDAARRWSKR